MLQTKIEIDDENIEEENIVERGVAFSAFGDMTSSDEEEQEEEKDKEEEDTALKKQDNTNDEKDKNLMEKIDSNDIAKEQNEQDNNNNNNISSKNKKKKKKKKKNNNKNKKNHRDNNGNNNKSSKKKSKQMEDDDALLDQAIKQGKLEQAHYSLLKSASNNNNNNSNSNNNASNNNNSHFSPLFIDKRKLSAQSEIRRRFGSNASSNHHSNSSQSQLRHRRRGNHSNNSGIKSRFSKANIFVDIDQRWPSPPLKTTGEGIWMILSDQTSQTVDMNCTYFSFETGMQYIAKQHEYEALRATHDPNHIQNFLRENPCHIDALVQMSAVYSMTQNHDSAALLMRQALYIFECGFHPKFLQNLENGSARMDLDIGTNKSFGNCVFAHALMAGRRGSRRAAYEMLKLLLILDPIRDPLNVLLCIDYYALSSREYESFLNLTYISPRKFGIPSVANNNNNSNGRRNFTPLTTLPNIFFAQALAMYYLGRGKKESNINNNNNEDGDQTDNNKYTYARAKNTLASALLRFPGMFLRLLEAIDSKLLKNDDLKYENDALLSSNLWKEEKGHPLIEKLIDIAVKKNAVELWKSDEVQMFLTESAEEAIVHYDSNSDLYRRQKTLRMTHYGIGLGNNIASNNHNIYRYQSVNPAIFQDDAVFLPPSSTPTAGTNNNNNTSYDSDLDLENTNAFLLFLQTLMPWNQVNPTTGTMLGGFMPQQLGEGGPIDMNNAEQIAIQQNILEQIERERNGGNNNAENE